MTKTQLIALLSRCPDDAVFYLVGLDEDGDDRLYEPSLEDDQGYASLYEGTELCFVLGQGDMI